LLSKFTISSFQVISWFMPATFIRWQFFSSFSPLTHPSSHY
jgi:hypothetical protein